MRRLAIPAISALAIAALMAHTIREIRAVRSVRSILLGDNHRPPTGDSGWGDLLTRITHRNPGNDRLNEFIAGCNQALDSHTLDDDFHHNLRLARRYCTNRVTPRA